ncbi:MAG: ABC transporter permease [Egibacteraceae bacterium]
MGSPVVEVIDVTRSYTLGDDGTTVHALRGVSLAVAPGELVAIIGPSGSGKSTLLCLLGALDRPTSGTVRFAGQDIATLSDTALARLRNREIGFVFQQFHLLGRTSAIRNVALPLVYAGVPKAERLVRARAALEAVGLGHRLEHRPAQLSGGEQQRVAIARALVTSPRLLLADEPTGNLDTATGAEVMALLGRLGAERGLALVVITHDPEVAAIASRRLHMRDGVFAQGEGVASAAPAGGDRRGEGVASAAPVGGDRRGEGVASAAPVGGDRRGEGVASAAPVGGDSRISVLEAAKVAVTAIVANRLRSFLTVLGVVIGVLSVVLLVAVGVGARDRVTSGIEELGSNLLFVAPGTFQFGSVPTLSKFTLSDVQALERDLGGRAAISGYLASGEQVRAVGGSGGTPPSTGDAQAFASVLGVTASFDRVVSRPLARGEFLTDSDIATGRRVVVLGAAAADGLFGDRDPIGKSVTIAGLRFRVVGVVERLGAALGVQRDSEVLIPITAAQRMFGTRRVDTIFVKAPSAEGITVVAEQVRSVLGRRLAPADFSVLTQDQILGVVGDILEVLTAVLAAIASISLLVGGIGVSNIMLVSVAERTREIGLRKALGARTRDVTVQFLVEAVVLCGVGGVIGIGLGVGFARLAAVLTPLPATVTWWSVALAFGVSATVGVVFGVFPARRAGRLDPVVALRYE